LSIVMQFTGIL